MKLLRRLTSSRSSQQTSSPPTTQPSTIIPGNGQTPPSEKKGFDADYTSGEYAVAASELVLSALDTVTTYAPVPYLKEASGLASTLLNKLLTMSDVETGFQNLVKEICGIIIIFSEECKKEPINPQLEKHVLEVISHLDTLKEMCEKYPRTKWWRKFLLPKVNAEKMASIKGELDGIFKEFYLRNVFAIRNGVDFWKDQNQHLLEKLQQMIKDLQESTKENLDSRASEGEESNPPLVDSAFSDTTIERSSVTHHANNNNNAGSFNGVSDASPSSRSSNEVDQSFMNTTITGGSTIINHSNNNNNVGSFNGISDSAPCPRPARRVDQSFSRSKITGSSVISNSNNSNNFSSFNQGSTSFPGPVSTPLYGYTPTPFYGYTPMPFQANPASSSPIKDMLQSQEIAASAPRPIQESRAAKRSGIGRRSAKAKAKQPILVPPVRAG